MKRFAFAILVLAVIAIGSCSVPYILHNRALSHVRAEYSSIKHPPSSLPLANFSRLGIAAGGNGNHCDYLVGEIRESDDSEEQIKSFYSGFKFPMMDAAASQWGPGPDAAISVQFPDIERDSGALGIFEYDIPDELRQARGKQRKKTLYVVYLLDGGYEPNGDIRCH